MSEAKERNSIENYERLDFVSCLVIIGSIIDAKGLFSHPRS